jgi:hypothetical protein
MPVLGFDSEIEIELSGPESIGSGAQFVAHVRERVSSSRLLATLSSSDGTIEVGASVAVVDPEPGFEYLTTFVLKLPGAVTRRWNVDQVVLDLARVDTTPDQYLGFMLEVNFAKPVTRL